MNRRGFLQAILAACVAPAVVGSGILMPVRMVFAPAHKLAWPETKWIDVNIDGPYGIIYPFTEPIIIEYGIGGYSRVGGFRQWGISRIAMPDHIAAQERLTAPYRSALDSMTYGALQTPMSLKIRA